jgi:hypothetical protein
MWMPGHTQRSNHHIHVAVAANEYVSSNQNLDVTQELGVHLLG